MLYNSHPTTDKSLFYMHTTRVWQQKYVQETSAALIALQFHFTIHKHHCYSMSSCWLQIDIWLDVD